MAQTPSIRLRAAAPDDAGAVRDLVRAAYAKWVARIGREPLPMQTDYERAIREHAVTLLHADGQLVALIEMIFHGDHLFIENVAVLPERQGRGLGRLLLAHAEETAIRRGLSEVRLLTNRAFESNVALYRALGYRIEREEPFLGGTPVHMSKRIGSDPSASGS